MNLKKIKKEIKSTISRKKKKNIRLVNVSSYALNNQYNFLIFFLKNYDVKLSRKLFSNLMREELGFFYSFNNWVHYYVKKIY